jgi:proline iminopeptidase
MTHDAGAASRPDSPTSRDTRSQVAVSGADLFTVTLGDGIPMLVLPGGMGLDHTYLRPWLDALGRFARLTFYDQRNNGRSSSHDPEQAFTYLAHVRDADQLRQAIGAERIVVFGHSFGGRIAQEYAIAHPDRVAGLILCSTDARFDYVEAIIARAAERGLPAQINALERAFSHPFATDDEWAANFRAFLPLLFHNPAILPALRSFDHIRFRARAFNASFFEAARVFDTRSRLAAITSPTLVLGGGDDCITPFDYGSQRLAKGIPKSELVMFQRSGHMPFIEESAHFVDVVGAWLRKLSA